MYSLLSNSKFWVVAEWDAVKPFNLESPNMCHPNLIGTDKTLQFMDLSSTQKSHDGNT